MAIKKKVTYSVSYTAGTDTLTTKLNSLLSDIVGLILSQNTGLSVLDTITVNSARWTGAPLYDTYTGGMIPAADYQDRHYQSDVVFLGTSEDNVCLSLGFFDGSLVVALNMCPKVEKQYTDVWSSQYGLGSLPFWAVGILSRWYTATECQLGNYAIPYDIIDNTISMSVIYWSGAYSRGYSFSTGAGQNDGVNLVIFPTDEGNGVTSLGFAIRPYGIVNAGRNGSFLNSLNIASFSENLSNNKAEYFSTGYYGNYAPNTPSAAVQVHCNAKYDCRAWSYQGQDSGLELGRKIHRLFIIWHTLGNSTGNTDYNYRYGLDMAAVLAVNTGAPFPLATAYNLPHLNVGQAYVRKMRIPGWNPECKGEIYLLWAPVLEGYKSGDIVEVGSKSFAIISEGAICWAARIS